MTAAAAGLALLPWLSRASARSGGSRQVRRDRRAVRGEAVPSTIAGCASSAGRRGAMHLVRSEDIELALVVWDAYAGRLRQWKWF